MGEIAEMMLDGTLCECCGTYIGADTGYPIKCDGCLPIYDGNPDLKKHKMSRAKMTIQRKKRDKQRNRKKVSQKTVGQSQVLPQSSQKRDTT